MARLALSGRAYQEQSLIASALKQVNLYAELNVDDAQAPTPVTYYQTPGFSLFSTPNNPAKARGEYRTSLGTGYIVIGPTLYNIAINGALVFVGSIPDRQSQVYMADNGLALVLVDGVGGYAVELLTNAFGAIIDPSFYGADFVVFLDTFFVFNRPATNQFYISLSLVSFGMLVGTAIGDGSISAAGAAYVNGAYDSVPLTGGSGTGATADITVAGGAVTAVDIANLGQGYLVGDVLSASNADLGGAGAGFTYTVSSFALAFDPLDIAAKSGSADPIVAITAVHKELWLIGALTTEVWIGTGAADFYFQLVQGAFIDHGCIAPYSVATLDILNFWLMRDRQGKNIVVQGANYEVKEISTPYLVAQFNKYIDTTDAVGFTFQISDHAFYCLIFPQANKSWLYDLTSKQWTEWNWYNSTDGSLNRHRFNCIMFVYDQLIGADWENGKVYKLDADLITDNGEDIVRIKTFAHLVDNYDRIVHKSFDADCSTGEGEELDENDPDPTIALSWSDDRGKSFGFPVEQSVGRRGEYLTVASWNRLGYARDRVYKLQWTVNIPALNGAFIEVQKAKT